jgi:hypothetical protein
VNADRTEDAWQFPRASAQFFALPAMDKIDFERSIPQAFLSAFRAFPLSTSFLPVNAASERAEKHLFLTIPRKRHFLRTSTRKAEKAGSLAHRGTGDAST